MICSISTGKCGSNWLDRLRSNKGFPVSEDLELDHFLANKINNPESESTQSRKAATEICGENVNGDDKGEWMGIMNNVLSDLFIMGESDESFNFSRKKNPRKQTNPKFCFVSSMTSNIEEQLEVEVEVELEQSSGGCVGKDENAHIENVLKEEVEGEEIVNNVEMEKGETEELFGYSKNEVTVIDTSSTEWKFEKLLYRKRNVWKVREKKGNSGVIGLGRKKRKVNGAGADANVNAKKKFKLLSQEECIFSSKHSPQVKEREEVHKETCEYPNHVPKKKPLSGLTKKAKNGGKSTVLRKCMSTASKKTTAIYPKSHSQKCGIEMSQVACNKALSITFPM